MSRYIDADALIRDLQERYCRPCKAAGLDYNEVRCRACQFDDEINDIDGFADNNIDIEPKRGEWIDNRGVSDKSQLFPFECSECRDDNERTTNFCPNCGADMREQNLKSADEDTAFGGLMSAT